MTKREPNECNLITREREKPGKLREEHPSDISGLLWIRRLVVFISDKLKMCYCHFMIASPQILLL